MASDRFLGWFWDDTNLYRARGGDSFDDIARQAYEDERLSSILLYANPDLAGDLILSGGELVAIPIISPVESPYAPPWRTAL